MQMFDVIVKVLPSGQAVKFGVLETYPIDYIYFQFRTLAGDGTHSRAVYLCAGSQWCSHVWYAGATPCAEGTDAKMELLLPTEVGAFHLSTFIQLPTALATPVDKGARTLAE